MTLDLHVNGVLIECGSILLMLPILSAVDSLALHLLKVFLDAATAHAAILELLKKSLLVLRSNG